MTLKMTRHQELTSLHHLPDPPQRLSHVTKTPQTSRDHESCFHTLYLYPHHVRYLHLAPATPILSLAAALARSTAPVLAPLTPLVPPVPVASLPLAILGSPDPCPMLELLLTLLAMVKPLLSLLLPAMVGTSVLAPELGRMLDCLLAAGFAALIGLPLLTAFGVGPLPRMAVDGV